MRQTVKIEQDDFSKDYYIVLPDELLEKMSWSVGDILKIDIILNGMEKSLYITKKEK